MKFYKTHLFLILWALSVVLLPGALTGLVEYSDDSLAWLLLHQIYYLPLGAWIGEPFFKPSSDVIFFATKIGKVLTAFVYSALWVGLWLAVNHLRKEKPKHMNKHRP